MLAQTMTPGALLRSRGREWVVVERSTEGDLLLRPLGGSDDAIEQIRPRLEHDIQPASFAPPDIARIGASTEARLLRDALALTLRRGAGPFRSFGRLAFEPRAYQLAPLLMAMKQETVRLLIADDVGIGKTVEAGLIVREWLDRGEAKRFTVICPPHLVDQWVEELSEKFAIDATPVTAATASRLERGLPIGESLFNVHPFTVVSLDFIKSDRRSNDFINACPRFVIVDEAHASAGAGEGRRQQRYNLLRRLAAKKDRHLVLLTATPHTGDSGAFARLIGLLDPDFEHLEDADKAERDAIRLRLADHFVQRRRKDIDAWKEPGLFPKHETREQTYRLHKDAASFFDDVLDYAGEVTERAGGDERKRRLAFWGTLALMRCVASSPTAAVQALKSRLGLQEADDVEPDHLRDQACDGEADDLPLDDTEPAIIGDSTLEALYRKAVQLAADPKRDAKLNTMIKEVKALVAEGFSPVIFCRFIATAKGVHAALEGALPKAVIDVVTGELPPEMRRERVEQLGKAETRVLVATDCLSEGINLQSQFDAVVHYDLCWNPTRHQQRQGRVDRFGQTSKCVRSLLLYGENNPVDGAVLNVILKKAERIRRETGVPVPLPDDERAMTEALMRAVLLRRRKRTEGKQLALFDQLPEAKAIDKAWMDAAEKEKQSQTRYAQRALKPDAVLPEWEKAKAALGGGAEAAERFLKGATARFGIGLDQRSNTWRFAIPEAFPHKGLLDRLIAAGVPKTFRLSFGPGTGMEHVHRAHPLINATADYLLERALDPKGDPGDVATLARAGVWPTRAVEKRTTVLLLRLRHRLIQKDGGDTMLAEEAGALAFIGKTDLKLECEGQEALALLDGKADHDVAEAQKKRIIGDSLERLEDLRPELDAYANRRAETLAADHDRLRAATMRNKKTSLTRTEVQPVTPIDIVGFYVLLPAID